MTTTPHVDELSPSTQEADRPRARRRITIAVLALLLPCCLAGGLWAVHRAASGPRLRGVLLISIDTCRADRLGCYGFGRDATPHIDEVARHAALFENAVSPVPITLPAHGTMLTGTIPPFHGAHDNNSYRLAERNVTVAELLKQHGFATGAFVAAFVMAERFGLNQGFDTYGFESTQNTTGMAERRGQDVSRDGIQWLEAHGDEPFFLFLHYYDPHALYAPPEPFASRFEDDPYAGEIAYVDQCVGQVLAKLQQMGLYDDTLIIITADHGEMLGEHGEATHSYFIYESALRVPLIVKRPRQQAPIQIDEQVGLIDVAPTICAAAGIEAPQDVQGADLSLYWRQDAPTVAARSFYCETLVPTKYGAASLLGIRRGDWKYIQTTRPELYNLADDPVETRNVVTSQPHQAKTLQDHLRQLLDRHARRLDDRHVAPNAQTNRKLESLGYVSGADAAEDFSFDQSKTDPKDLIDFHTAYANELNPLIHAGRCDEARRVCERLVAERPDFALAHFKLGVIARSTGRYSDAIEHFHRALQLNLDDADVHYNLAVALHARGDFGAAIEGFTTALERDPSFFEAHNGLANALFATRKTDQAIEHYGRALQIQADYADGRFNMAIAFQSKGAWGESIPHLRRALASRPDHARSQLHLGMALASTGQVDEATKVYRAALRVEPDFALAHYNLGVLVAATGHGDEGIAHLREAARLAPDSQPVRRALDRALATRAGDGSQ